MHYRVRLFKGIFSPSYRSQQLEEAEFLTGYRLRLLLIITASALLYMLAAYFGMGLEQLSNKITRFTGADFEARKLLFVAGKGIFGIVYASAILFFPALIFWIAFDAPYRKLVVIQMFVLLVLLIEKALFAVLALRLGLDSVSSPFTLGVAMQYLTNNEFWIILFSSISLFHIWTLYLQTCYIKKLTEKSSRIVYLIVIAVYIFVLLISTLFSYIRFDKLL
ncbi:hypothetical protein [Bacillus infantis]|uniref:hypothetical protein n=1 Tax=Bacillus infantis TaxID=324767 RepID=UPI0021553BDA|nr:hypothetical protein [Bacillus infantis]MCR6612785.1 hypothetical protein [Bacillus infantis]